eukprot:180371_1
MSGAFNVDIEIERLEPIQQQILLLSGFNRINYYQEIPTDITNLCLLYYDERKMKIYCTSLINIWQSDHTVIEVEKFYHSLCETKKIKSMIKHWLSPPVNEISVCEVFISRISCTALLLRDKLYWHFLNIPQPVTDGLYYASSKPFGDTLKQGYLKRHSRFVKRNATNYWFKLTQDNRRGSLICYDDQNGIIISHFKLHETITVLNLNDIGIENAFLLKCGKREWALQALSNTEYADWMNQMAHIENVKQYNKNQPSELYLKIECPLNDTTWRKYHTLNISTEMSINAQKINNELKCELDLLMDTIDNMKLELGRLKSINLSHIDMKLRLENEYVKERNSLMRDYEIQTENLKNEAQELERKILFNPSGCLFDGEFKVEIDAEKHLLETCINDERSKRKFIHKHLHKHRHKHSHHHKHVYVHKDD